MSIPALVLIFLAAATGSAVNSVAGGGTLVTFPAIVWLGLSPLVANATSTVALWPGAVGSMWGYRGELTNRPVISFGIEKATYRHAFSLVFSNTRPMTENRYAQGTGGSTVAGFMVPFRH